MTQQLVLLPIILCAQLVKLSEDICQASIDIKEYFVVLSRVMQKLYETGLQGVPKIHKAMKSMHKHLAHFKVFLTIKRHVRGVMYL